VNIVLAVVPDGNRGVVPGAVHGTKQIVKLSFLSAGVEFAHQKQNSTASRRRHGHGVCFHLTRLVTEGSVRQALRG
jgi:hypothetical protein